MSDIPKGLLHIIKLELVLNPPPVLDQLQASMKDIVIKTNINCQICQTDVLKAIAKLIGISGVVVNDQMGTLTIFGDVDPVLVVKRLRKAGKVAEIISVGPLKPSEPMELLPVFLLPSCCNQCQLVGVSYAPYFDGGVCNIL